MFDKYLVYEKVLDKTVLKIIFMEVFWTIQEEFKLGTHLGSFVDLNDEEVMIIGGYNYDDYHNHDIQVIKINKNNLKITKVPIENPIRNRAGIYFYKLIIFSSI